MTSDGAQMKGKEISILNTQVAAYTAPRRGRVSVIIVDHSVYLSSKIQVLGAGVSLGHHLLYSK